MLIKLSDNSIVRTMNQGIDPNVQTKPGFKWLPCDFVTKPDFNSDTEIVEGPFYAVGGKDVVESWNKRPLTAEELDVRKDGKVSAMDALQFKLSFDMENRMRAVEGKQPVTAAQYRNALKARL